MLLAAVVCAASPAWAQQARVQLSLDRSLAYVGEEVRVEVAIRINGRVGYERYLPPSFEGFRVLGSGMSSQNIEIINMQVRRTESYVYTVTPAKVGSLKVGPAAVMSGGKMIKSQVVKLQVKQGSARPAPAAPDPTAPPQPGAGGEDRGQGRAAFILVDARPERVYIGQEVLATWTLYVAGNIGMRSPQVSGLPATDGFWSEDHNSPSQLSYEQKVVNGNVFNVALLLRKKLFAQKTGKLSLGPMKMGLTLVQFFNSRRLEISSEAKQIEVLPLPAQGKPAGFVPGNVGRFDLTTTLDRDKIKGGDAVTLQVVVRGDGNVRQLNVPALTAMDGFKVYEPKVTDNLALGEKKLEYLLMPTRAGRLKVPSIAVPTFDPASGEYRVLRSEPLALTVTGPMPQALTPRKDPRKNVLGPSIRPPRPADAPLTHEAPFRPLSSAKLWGLFLAPLLLLGLVTGGERLRDSLRRETPRRQQRAAARRIKAHLKTARDLSRAGDKEAFFSEVAAALRDLLDHRLGARMEGLTRPELGRELERRGFPPELVSELLQELDNCDFARFSPSGSDPREMDQALKRTRKLLDRINRVKLADVEVGP